MSEWIEINLPWDNREWLQLPYQEFPDLNERAKTVFGETIDEVRERTVYSIRGENEYDYPVFTVFEKLREEVEQKMVDEGLAEDNFYDSETSSTFRLELHKRLESLDNINVKLVYEYRDFKNKYDAWLDAQPENIAVTEHNKQIQKDFKDKQKEEGTSFRARGLNRAGTLLEVMRGDETIYMLIGTINELGGSCDDCRDINDDDIIKRYKIIWKPDNT